MKKEGEKPQPKPKKPKEKPLTQKPAKPGAFARKGGAFQEFVNSLAVADNDDDAEEEYSHNPNGDEDDEDNEEWNLIFKKIKFKI